MADTSPQTGSGHTVVPAAPAVRSSVTRRHNLTTLLVDRPLAAGGGDRPALRWAGGAWSYEQLAARTAAAAAWWRSRGVGRGDTVVLALPDGPEWVALFLGAQHVGAVCALAAARLSDERLTAVTARLDPVLVLRASQSGGGGGGDDPAVEAYAAVVSNAPAPPIAPVRPDDAAYMLLTSGSTGPPKWAVHRTGDIAACIATYGRRVLKLRPTDVTWSVAVLATSYGLGNSCYFPLGAGACAVVAGSDRSPNATADACARHGVTALFGVPTSWARLARHTAAGHVAPEAFATVRLAVSAGEHLPAAVWHAVRHSTGLRLVNSLGSSELSNLYLSDRPGNPRPGTVGWPVAGYQVRPADPAGAGGDGELLVRGPTMLARYHGVDGDPAPGAWFPTGDVVRREGDGSHTYVRRLGDRFKSGGLWVDADRVRRALCATPGVRGAVVVAVRDADGLDRVGAAVEVAAPPAAEMRDRIAAAAREALAAHEVPRVLLVLEALPTAASGKADRGEIIRRLVREFPSRPRAGRDAA